MPVYHVVLFKLKPDVPTDAVSKLEAAALAMVGIVPGLLKMNFGPPHESTAHRSQGYNMGLVAILDKPETIKV